MNQWKNKKAIILVMSLAQNIFKEYAEKLGQPRMTFYIMQ